MKKRLLLVLALATLSTGCTEIMGRMEGLPLHSGLDQALVKEGIRIAAELGWKLAGALVVLLGFHCWYKAMHGEAWLGLLKEYLGGIVVCIVMLTSLQSGQGPIQWILDAGMYLAERFNPGIHAFTALQTVITKYAGIINDAVRQPPSPGEAAFRYLEAWQYYMSLPGFAAVLIINTAAIFVMRLIVQAAFVWLVAFYQMVGPLVVPFVILPQTRHIFVGWLRTLIALSLWPWLFAIAERLAVAVPYATWIGTDQYNGSLASGIEAIMQGQFMFLVLNVVFFFVYLGIPVAAHMLVSGATRAFRGVLA
jgi:hypothetical protein